MYYCFHIKTVSSKKEIITPTPLSMMNMGETAFLKDVHTSACVGTFVSLSWQTLVTMYTSYIIDGDTSLPLLRVVTGVEQTLHRPLGNNHSCDLAPVPLSIFRSNSKFDENSKHSSVKYTRPITTIFCTRHDSVTVVTCAKYRCDRSNIFETRAFWIFIEFRIRSKYA